MYVSPFEMLNGKAAVITGSGRGIGRAIALELAGHGVNVAVNYFRHKDRAEETAREVERAGSRAVVVKAHMGDAEDVERLVNTAVETFGGVDILIGNAASGVLRPVLQQEQKGWDWFSLHLSDGRDLMIYFLRLTDGSVEPASSGTLVLPNGASRHLLFSEVTMDFARKAAQIF